MPGDAFSMSSQYHQDHEETSRQDKLFIARLEAELRELKKEQQEQRQQGGKSDATEPVPLSSPKKRGRDFVTPSILRSPQISFLFVLLTLFAQTSEAPAHSSLLSHDWACSNHVGCDTISEWRCHNNKRFFIVLFIIADIASCRETHGHAPEACVTQAFCGLFSLSPREFANLNHFVYRVVRKARYSWRTTQCVIGLLS